MKGSELGLRHVQTRYPACSPMHRPGIRHSPFLFGALSHESQLGNQGGMLLRRSWNWSPHLAISRFANATSSMCVVPAFRLGSFTHPSKVAHVVIVVKHFPTKVMCSLPTSLVACGSLVLAQPVDNHDHEGSVYTNWPQGLTGSKVARQH